MAVNNVKSQGTPTTPAPSQGAGEAKRSHGAAQVKQAANAYAKAANAPTVSNAANVQISPQAKEMSLARKVIDETPDVREDKVTKFKAAIASGEYKPDAGKIADGILNEAIKDEVSKDPAVALG